VSSSQGGLNAGAIKIEVGGAEIAITEIPDGRRHIEVRSGPDDVFISKKSCRTRYPVELIRAVLELKGPSHLCDEILREEDAGYVQRSIEHELLAYFAPAEFEGKRILDFGCGSGASTMVLARMFPQSEIVGTELLASYVGLARKRAAYYGYGNVSFLVSPSGTELPAGIGMFDCVVMSAVYEHLLPLERETVLRAVWSSLKPGGILFLNQTPYRYFPIEAHTTGLPLLNYLPDSIAKTAARRFCKRIAPDENWESMLRRGIRGGSEKKIQAQLGADAILVEPQRFGKDRIDLWFSELSPRRRPVKQVIRLGLKSLRAVTGITMIPELSLAFKKRR
jgi:2-polyprenyl-3-methyl-5-hydroxy-6-metoxy-1,4-benzoquinol methylase